MFVKIAEIYRYTISCILEDKPVFKKKKNYYKITHHKSLKKATWDEG